MLYFIFILTLVIFVQGLKLKYIIKKLDFLIFLLGTVNFSLEKTKGQ